MSSTGRRRPSARKFRLLSVLGAGLFALLIASIPTPAAAHGATMMPGSRTYLCYLDLVNNSSTQMPSNPACASAVQQGGTGPLYNWFAVLDSNGGGRTTGYIPDGTLCSGGNRGPFNFSAYNATRADWPKTHLTSGQNIELHHSNWAHHPGRFDVYITKNGWSPTQPVGWGNLERISTVTNPPQRGGAGSNGGYYYWNVQLPSRSGQHVLYVHWSRSDSQENFYSCSDIVFDGGSGQVTYGDGRTLSAEEVAEAGEAAQELTPAVQDDHAAHAEHAAHTGSAEAASPTGSSTATQSALRATREAFSLFS
ncbi:lytic polysaccharide monooxygenase auxiliary activity family 9 protein [Streptomyces sp. SBT349]|uniref:lytic polysaccharide monooxygenase auxiliary activity family 9 protein n=1 Tax=Streptomyces sp. SBT349 TaxID=1580539 RepID=UPI00066EE572|nr:lytic polysaccharide monooxygenase [Streptomyces sp. SBT349]